MDIRIERVDRLLFADGTPVRAASGIAPFGDGLLVVQDDGTHAGWLRDGGIDRLRVFPPVRGLDLFEEGAGTKHLKPDLEAAVAVEADGVGAVLLLGSGSSPARMRWALVEQGSPAPSVTWAELGAVYATVAEALGVRAEDLNLEGACVVGDRLRWFHRGLPASGLPSGSVDLPLAEAIAAVRGERGGVDVVGAVRSYELGSLGGAGLAVTDAVALPDGRILVSAAAELTDNPRDDGPVAGAALVLLDGSDVVASAALPEVDGSVRKVEGLAVLWARPHEARLVAVVDADDPREPSLALRLAVDY